MKYYSEELKRPFDTVEELEAAEKEKKEQEQKKNELSLQKKSRADEIKKVYDSMLALTKDYNAQIKKLQGDYNSKIKKFVEDYGSYHYSYNSNDVDDIDALPTLTNTLDGFRSIFEPFFDSFKWFF